MSDGSTWMLRNKKADFAAIGARLGADPLAVRVMANRGIAEGDMAEFLSPSLSSLGDPFRLKDMDRAAAAVWDAVSSGTKIRVIGDYDVDGIFSAYILTAGIRRIGGDVSFDIPHRIRDGYGMNARLIRKASDDGAGLIVTCDNGIKATDEARLAKELGMRVVITDHHELGYKTGIGGKEYIIPEAEAAVDPHRPD